MKQVATMVHPAWIAVEGLLTDNRRWIARLVGRPEGYYDWQIALAMIVAGFGDDLVVLPNDDGTPTGYQFPPYKVAVDEDADDRKPLNPEIPVHALLTFFAEQMETDSRPIYFAARQPAAPAVRVNGNVHRNGNGVAK